MKYLLSAMIVFVVGFTACTRQYALTEEEAIRVIKAFDEGWRNKNLKMVDSVLAPSYIYFTQSGGTFSRGNLVLTAGSSEYTLQSMDRSAFFVQLYGNTAVVSTRWKGKGMYQGVPFDEDQRCSITIIKKSNKVEILSEHCTPIKPSRLLH